MKEDATSADALLSAEGLCKFYGGREVLHEVHLSVKPGEIVTIVGPNGAGKTTLLHCLIGLLAPDRGSITRAPDLRIGYVPQHFRAQPSMPMRVVDFLRLYAPRADARMGALAAELQVGALLHSELASLSGGELRRVLLLRALLRSPQLLVLDEPTQGVDAAGQGELYRLLKRLSDSHGFAVLMVSHDLYMVMASTSRVICLNHHICCEGVPSRIGSEPAFKELFGEDLARQLALYHHHHNHSHGIDAPHFDHAHDDAKEHSHG